MWSRRQLRRGHCRREQQERNLIDTIMHTGGQLADDMGELVEVLRATGQRKPMGSATSFNTAYQDAMSTGRQVT